MLAELGDVHAQHQHAVLEYSAGGSLAKHLQSLKKGSENARAMALALTRAIATGAVVAEAELPGMPMGVVAVACGAELLVFSVERDELIRALDVSISESEIRTADALSSSKSTAHTKMGAGAAGAAGSGSGWRDWRGEPVAVAPGPGVWSRSLRLSRREWSLWPWAPRGARDQGRADPGRRGPWDRAALAYFTAALSLRP
jgi:hypothetical protein